jgi:hypothetical protein
MLLRLGHKDELNFYPRQTFSTEQRTRALSLPILYEIIFPFCPEGNLFAACYCFGIFAGPDIPPPRTRASPGWRDILFAVFLKIKRGETFEKPHVEKRTFIYLP